MIIVKISLYIKILDSVVIKRLCKALGLTRCVLYSSISNPNTQQLATRMATLGTIESFNPSLEDWNAYSERFDQYVIANDIKDEKKIVATFLTTIGSKTYNALRDLLAPANTLLT